jgi:membrane protease YdiL (CAAX protease family)
MKSATKTSLRNKHHPQEKNKVCIAYIYMVILYAVWILLHAIDRVLATHFLWIDNNSFPHVIYYLTKKITIWVLPALFIIYYSHFDLKKIMGFNRLKSIFVWGGGVGLMIGIVALAVKYYIYKPIFSFILDWNFYNTILVSPIVEELVFRGAVLQLLKTKYSFFISNLITGVFFLGIHLPGWYFQGRLLTHLLSPTGALSIFVLGLIFGYVAERSKSVTASTITHILSNFFYY